MTTPENILVTGATGQLGRLVIADLLKIAPSAHLIGLVRNPAAAKDLADRGVELRTADYNNPASVAAALRGADKVLLISSSEVGQRVAQHRNVIDAAKAAGVELLAYTSILRADTSPGRPLDRAQPVRVRRESEQVQPADRIAVQRQHLVGERGKLFGLARTLAAESAPLPRPPPWPSPQATTIVFEIVAAMPTPPTPPFTGARVTVCATPQRPLASLHPRKHLPSRRCPGGAQASLSRPPRRAHQATPPGACRCSSQAAGRSRRCRRRAARPTASAAPSDAASPWAGWSLPACPAAAYMAGKYNRRRCRRCGRVRLRRAGGPAAARPRPSRGPAQPSAAGRRRPAPAEATWRAGGASRSYSSIASLKTS